MAKKIISRSTEDVDILAMRGREGGVDRAFPMPQVLKKAAAHAADELRLGENWFNSAASLNFPDPVAIRSAMGLSQTKFAQLIDVGDRTLYKWEQHTSSPRGAAKTLLKIAATNPHSVREALRSS